MNSQAADDDNEQQANRAYKAYGIYHLLRHHADLRVIVADIGVQGTC